MASVQELLAAAEAKKSPFISLAEGVTQGFGQSQQNALPRISQMLQIGQLQQQMENQKKLAKMVESETERNTSLNFKKATGEAPDTTPQVKLQKKITMDKDGYKLTFESPTPTKKTFQAKEYLDEQGRARTGKFDTSTGDFIKSASDPFASGRERGTIGNDLRKEFTGLKEVQDYVKVYTEVNAMDSLMESAKRGDMQSSLALDQGLITMYNKLTDPNSVVRESEYERTPQNLSFFNRLTGKIQKLKEGGAGLTMADREELVRGAKIIANARGNTYSERRKEYELLANKLGADPSTVIGTIADFKGYQITSPKEGKTAEQRYKELLKTGISEDEVYKKLAEEGY